MVLVLNLRTVTKIYLLIWKRLYFFHFCVRILIIINCFENLRFPNIFEAPCHLCRPYDEITNIDTGNSCQWNLHFVFLAVWTSLITYCYWVALITKSKYIRRHCTPAAYMCNEATRAIYLCTLNNVNCLIERNFLINTNIYFLP